MARFVLRTATLVIWLAGPVGPAAAQDSALADYFGFDGLEVVKIDRHAGPMSAADLDGDGLMDLIVANNHSSRIELLYQKRGASPDDEVPAVTRANDLPRHWRFRYENVTVSHRIQAAIAHDFDGDGLLDLIYAGIPSEIVFVRQSSPGTFEIGRRHRVRNLAATRTGFAVANVIGDEQPELLALVGEDIQVWPMDSDDLGEPTKLVAGDTIVAFFVEDYNGDGRNDIAAVIPDDTAPVRIWFGNTDDGQGVLSAQIRFEMPPVREFKPVRLPDQPAARIAVIERASKRLVLSEIADEPIEGTGDRDAAMWVYGFTDSGNRQRDVAVVDADGDGLLDMISTDTRANALVLYRQVQAKGLQSGETFPSLSEIDYIAAGNVDDDPYAELFVMSEKEGVVGRCDLGPDGIPFPQPLSISEGFKPVALNLVELDERPYVAVVLKEGRDHVVDLIGMDGNRQTIQLGSLSRSPETILALDADQNGQTDLLLFTRDKPMTMLYAGEDGFTLTESKDMGQFGLVQAAKSENTAVHDVDGDGLAELLIGDKNYVRAVRYVEQPGPGVSPGWQVVTQINANDSASKLVSLAVLGDRILAADTANDRLVLMSKANGAWRETESVNVQGFRFSAIHTGQFSGDRENNILAVGDDSFAVIRLAGSRTVLREFASWRSDDERRAQYEVEAGDLNSDGFTDLATLDAGEQMCEIFSLTEQHRLLYATGFQVFESRVFSGGEARQFEPSQIIIVDVTGDGANDLVMLAHDRVLIYPQMVLPDG